MKPADPLGPASSASLAQGGLPAPHTGSRTWVQPLARAVTWLSSAKVAGAFGDFVRSSHCVWRRVPDSVYLAAAQPHGDF